MLRLRDHTVTLAELLAEHTPGWEPPPLTGREVLAQVHCHQHAVLGWDADASLLESAGAKAEHLESGCCGLAGNFGFQPGHAGVSESLAEQVLLPRLRDASPGAVVLADGFSCRTQIHELDSGGREAMHLAELLAAAGDLPAERPEVMAARPAGRAQPGRGDHRDGRDPGRRGRGSRRCAPCGPAMTAVPAGSTGHVSVGDAGCALPGLLTGP